MATQTPISDGRGEARDRHAPRGVARNVSGLAHDIVALGELQTQLFKIDLSDSVRRIVMPVVMIAIAGVTALACLPVLLFGASFWLSAVTNLPQWAALLIVSVVGMIVAGVMAGIAYGRLKSGPINFDRSLYELNTNLSWIKGALKREHEGVCSDDRGWSRRSY